MNDINVNGSRLLPTSGARSAYLDVNGDGYVTSLDGLEVSSFLNTYGMNIYTPDPDCSGPSDNKEASDAVCGNGVKEGAEVCDDGGSNGQAGK